MREAFGVAKYRLEGGHQLGTGSRLALEASP